MIDVRQSVELLGRLREALAQERQAILFGPDRDLTCAGPPKLPRSADEIAQIQQLGQSPLLAQHLLAQAHLDRAAAVSQREENQLADIAEQNDPPGAAGLLAFLRILESGLDRLGGLRLFEARPIGVDPHRFELLNLLLSLLFESVYIGLTRQRATFCNLPACQFVTSASVSISLVLTTSRPTASCGSALSVSSHVRFL